MVANAATFMNALLPGAYIDHGLGDDAKRLRNSFNQIFKSSPSITLDDRYREALVALAYSYEEASEDNWDGYGARKAQAASFKNGKAFLLALPTTLPLPEVSVDPDGEMSFSWQKGPRLVLSISISKDGVLNYAGLFGRNKTHGTEHFIEAIPKTITDNLERLFFAGR